MNTATAADTDETNVNMRNRRKPKAKPFVWFCSPMMKGKDMVTFVRTVKENLRGGETK